MDQFDLEKDYSSILGTRETIRQLFSKIKSVVDTKKTRDKMKYMRSNLNFVRLFSSESVQGTAGIVTLKGVDNVPIVFKVSNGVDYAIEHESIVLNDLKEIEKFCPHFMSRYTTIELPVCSLFFSDPSDELGFMEDSTDYLMTPVMFTEYISKYTYYHFLMTGNVSVINSLILQSLCALSISQHHSKFTHYDLHLDNVLIKNCDVNTIHAYKLPNGQEIVIPTYGNVPVMIDMGSSYSKSNTKLTTSIEHYHHGLQSCVFDKMNDLHHFLLSTLSCLSEGKEYYQNVYYNVMCLFATIPLLRNKGWKILDYDLVEEAEEYLISNCEFAKNKRERHAFREYFSDIIETINASIDIPFKEFSIEEINSKLPKLWDTLFSHIYKIITSESVSNDTECVYIIKEIVNTYNKIRNGENTNSCIETVKNRLNTILEPSECKQIKIKEIISVLSELSDYLGAFYNMFLKNNMKVINDAYNLMRDGFKINDVNDFIRVLQKVIPCSFDVKENDVYTVYYFDSIEKTSSKKEIIFSEKEVNEFNGLSNINKYSYICKKMG